MVPLALFAAASLTMVYRVATQSSPAVCQGGYEWMNNSKHQDPCLVMSFILGPCVGGSPGFVPALPLKSHYINRSNSPCTCNTPFYSIISACATCQGSGYLSWPTWETNCSLLAGIDVTKYPFATSSETEIPVWAFLGVPSTDDGMLNLTQIHEIALHLPPPAETNTSSTAPSIPSATAGPALVAPEPDPEPQPEPEPEPQPEDTRDGSRKGGWILLGVLLGIVLVMFCLTGLHRLIKGRWPSMKHLVQRTCFVTSQSQSQDPESQRKADAVVPNGDAYPTAQLEMNVLNYVQGSGGATGGHQPEVQPAPPGLFTIGNAGSFENVTAGGGSDNSSSTSSRLDELSWPGSEIIAGSSRQVP